MINLIGHKKKMQYVYNFLAGYKYNSSLYINNFMRDTISSEEIIASQATLSKVPFKSNYYSNNYYKMFECINEFDFLDLPYYPINKNYIEQLIALDMYFESHKTEKDLVLYRGCSNIEKDGFNSITSTSFNYNVAEKYSNGTILTILLPKNSSYIDLDQLTNNFGNFANDECEVILPPCDYNPILSLNLPQDIDFDELEDKNDYYVVEASPRDFVLDFYNKLNNLPREYQEELLVYKKNYLNQAKQMLEKYLDKKEHKKRRLHK